jgi:ABC-type polysaccharide/polyol phosphate export permease
VAVFILAYGVEPTWTWLLLPVVIAALTVFTTAVSTTLSALYVRFRDVAIIWTVVVTVLFYATPVLYPFEKAPAGFEQLLMIIPLTPLFVEARQWIIDPSAPSAVSAAGGWLQLLPALVIYLGTCALAVWVFRREVPRMAEEL